MNKKIILASVAAGFLIVLVVSIGLVVKFSKGVGSEDNLPGEPLNPSDFMAADQLKASSPSYAEDDPILRAKLLEGDIVNVVNADPGVQENAISNTWGKWPESVIPYTLARSFNSEERSIIAKGIKEIEEKTCIRFVPRTTSHRGYVDIMVGSHCYSAVGRTGSRQELSLGNNCVHVEVVLHELLHAIGFRHEHNRVDRDRHITIHWGNIQTGMERWFRTHDPSSYDDLGAEYDTCSIMHYGSQAFTKTWGLKTIEQKHDTGCQIGLSKVLSDTDIRKVNTLYSCSGYPQVGGGSVKPTVKPTVKPEPSCTDTHQACDYWARQNECRRNPGYMLVNCPESCHQCGLNCEDSNVHCEAWAAGGWCVRNPGYMNLYCAKSCQRCSASDRCKDEDKECVGFAKKGYCNTGKIVDFMNLRCKKSCQRCSTQVQSTD